MTFFIDATVLVIHLLCADPEYRLEDLPRAMDCKINSGKSMLLARLDNSGVMMILIKLDCIINLFKF